MDKFEKLVRDKIPEIIEQNGEIPVHRQLDYAEYNEKLKLKLQEELDEVLAAKTKAELIEELADLKEVFEAFCQNQRISEDNIKQKQIVKRLDCGGFRERVYLERVK